MLELPGGTKVMENTGKIWKFSRWRGIVGYVTVQNKRDGRRGPVTDGRKTDSLNERDGIGGKKGWQDADLAKIPYLPRKPLFPGEITVVSDRRK